jgi:hypothetical protein
MEEKLTGWGGPRPNSGRRPVKDKKKPLTVYIKGSDIKRHGGPIKTKTKIIEFIEA